MHGNKDLMHYPLFYHADGIIPHPFSDVYCGEINFVIQSKTTLLVPMSEFVKHPVRSPAAVFILLLEAVYMYAN